MIFIILPAYNEATALKVLIPELASVLKPSGQDFHIVVVNDGSTDTTALVLKDFLSRYPLTVLTHEQNKGYGAALNTGINSCLKTNQSSDIIVTMDADRSHPPSLVPAMISKIQEGCAAVTASPFSEGGSMTGVPWYRLLLSHTANNLFRIYIGLPRITSYTSGFRAYTHAVITNVFEKFGTTLLSSGFTASTELFLKASLLGGQFCEVPLLLRYDLKPGRSKMRIGKTILAYLNLLCRYRHWRRCFIP